MQNAVQRGSATLAPPNKRIKRLKVFFYTSSTDKFLQARHFLSKYGFVIDSAKGNAPYKENYSHGKEELLSSAIDQVISKEKQMAFFVEDTSLRIEALSESDSDYPGLEVKEWFQRTSYQDLDRKLKSRGNNRKATIKSGIALHLPGLNRPVYFYGHTSGEIASTPPSFTSSPLYPWLSAKSFDGWFIPDGTSKRLGEMSVDESTRVHFRSRALGELANRLIEYSAVLNLPSSAFHIWESERGYFQPSLFDSDSRLIVICGKRATGKSTAGEYCNFRFEIPHYEASTIVRMYYREYSEPDESLLNFSNRLHLTQGNDIIAKLLVSEFDTVHTSFRVITGLRKIEELEYLKKYGIKFKLLYLNCADEDRYARYLDRAREDSVFPMEIFLKEDNENIAFHDYAKNIADIIIDNKYGMEHFLSQITFAINPDGVRLRPSGMRIRQAEP